MDSLRSLSSPSAAVLRDGKIETIPSVEVAPGDVVQIKAGDTIPADLKLFESMNLECDEKILTGEVLAVAKDVKFDNANSDELSLGVGNRLNMAYSSSTVTKGRGQGVVVFTGMYTEIGKIAASMQGKQRKANRSLSNKESKIQPAKGIAVQIWDGIGAFFGLTTGTPLQRKLSKLAYVLFGCAILLAIILFGVNRFNVTNEVAIYAISTGIAIIPESLIAVLTITMIVLGGVMNICSDTTGTLTQGQMITRTAWIPSTGVYTVNGAEEASNPTSGSVSFSAVTSVEEPLNEKQAKSKADARLSRDKGTTEKVLEVSPGLQGFLQSTALCNLASVRHNDHKNECQAIGDLTEIALQVFAHRFNHGKRFLEENQGWSQYAEYPFDSSIKRISVVYSSSLEEIFVFTKGAVESILDLCTTIGSSAHQSAITQEQKDLALNQMTLLADQGFRVIAIVRRTITDLRKKSTIEYARSEIEKDLILLGLACL